MTAHRVSVLLVDDDYEDFLVTRDLLAKTGDAGLSLDWVGSFSDALDAMQQLTHDVYLLDYKLGRRDGLELLRAGRDAGCTAPIIMLTGYGSRDVDLEAMRHGAADFLVKGDTDARLLERTIRYALDRSKRSEALRLLREAVDQAAESIVIAACPDVAQVAPRIVYANPAFTQMSGYRTEEALGQTLDLLNTPESEPAFLERMHELVARGEHFFGERVGRRRDGRTILMSWHVGPIRNQLGRITHLVALQEDITERRRAAQERERLEHELRQKQKTELVGRMAGTIAHDFNNLLAVMLGFSQTLEAKVPEDDPRHVYAAEITRAAERAAALTSKMLAVSGKQVLQAAPSDLNQLISDMSAIVRSIATEERELGLSLDPALQPVEVDRAQFEQVLLNLAVNACDAMPDGGTLTISTFNLNVEEREPAAGIDLPPLGSYAAVAVTDTGTGMDEETAARVFDPFFTTKQIGKGTGLGLAIVRGIVEQSGGHVSLKSTVGQGTTFIVSFPAAAGASPADAVTEAPSPADRSGRDATVLVVDDEESLARVVATTLREHGFAVLETASPVDALKRFLASEQQIDVLVTDVVMPGMRGPVLAERLRERHPNMRVLYISGYTDDSLASGGSLSAGAHFLRKPFTQEELARSVTEALPA